eukprot:12885207-Ditylum_brightwellii.AAC.1
MRTDYNPPTRIEKYIARIKKCMDIAANGGAPYSQEQILMLAFDAMYRTGLCNEKSITWKDMAPADKTWPNWKIFFMKVIQDKRRLKRAAGTSYNTSSAVAETLQQDTIDALANLASATADDKNT